MSLDALVLALTSVIRPTSVASVYAMLSAARPTRLLAAYIVAGMIFSVGVGVALVALLGVSVVAEAPDEVHAAIALVLGAISLGYAGGLLSGWVSTPTRRRRRNQAAGESETWLGRQLADLSAPRAALVGVLTHVPGILYLAALSAITASTSSNTNRIFQVLVYNVIWFAMPLTALVLAARRSAELQKFLRRVSDWIWRHQHQILITVFGLLGVYLIVRGIVEVQR
ncbi:GAP family protein [Pseudonocardia sp.]|uniref:GAP family protein n=1 Tax=Pseudonocardia sp. TaxID=60912 RepID=UPI003D0F429A